AWWVLPARWAVTGIAGAYSAALLAGWAVTAAVLHRRLSRPDPVPGPAAGAAGPPWRGLLRSATAAAQARLAVAAVPATALGYLVARWAAPAGPPAAATAGAAAIAGAFLLCARPLRLTELEVWTGRAAARLRRPRSGR
ncbi:murein biosynthesis integral membrane protein MurJ, partial [Streptomyces sp. NPDC047970]